MLLISERDSTDWSIPRAICHVSFYTSSYLNDLYGYYLLIASIIKQHDTDIIKY